MQSLGEQVVPMPEKVLEPVHPLAIVIEHWPRAEQQAPRRAGHGLAVQAVPSPWKAEVPVHPP